MLVTLPLVAGEYEEFADLIEGAGGSVALKAEALVDARDVEGASVILGNVPAAEMHAPAGLEWLQTSSAGYDHYLTAGRLAAHTLLTNAVGAYGQAVSEHMLAQLLCLMKKLHLYRDRQLTRSWADQGEVRSLVGARVLVMGAGDIGTSFARLVAALGAQVTGVRRTRVEPQPPYVRMATPDQLHELLGTADVVACALPSTDRTRGLADRRFFEAMPRGSYFLNAGRGDLVVNGELAEALRSGRLAGAALDVTSPEPLPEDDELWSLPQVIISPHVAGFWHLPATRDAVLRICLDNLRAYLADEPLANMVAR